ncbi:MAG: cyclic nucleotide-binding domain-containing protein [Myxococcales bacterium]|nr:cyclic nucleotide-binding domain-containing protein [Myxococcales bacterium]
MGDRIVGGVISEKNLVGILVGMLHRGDLDAATQLYEQGGRAIAEQMLSALQKADPQMRDAAARMYVQARDFARGARLYEQARFWPDAAKLYEEAGDLASAARCWKKAGEPQKAARALHASGAVEEAAALYQELKQPDARAAVLARGERWLESAKAYRDAGNTRAETDVLRTVPVEHPDRVPAVKRLAEILLKRNRASEAAQLVADAARDNETGRTDVELHDLLASLFDQIGQAGHAERVRLRAQRLRARQATPEAVPAGETPPPEQDGYRFLKQIPIFARLTLGDMRDLHRLATEETWTPGQQIVDAGIDAPGLVILLDGDAEVYALGPSGARHLNSLGPGAHVGEISLLTKSLTSARVTASTEVRGLRIDRERFEMYLASHPAAALRIYQLFSEGLAERVRALSVP